MDLAELRTDPPPQDAQAQWAVLAVAAGATGAAPFPGRPAARAGKASGRAAALIHEARAAQARGAHARAGVLLTEAIERTRQRGAERDRALAVAMLGVSLWHGPEPAAVAIERILGLLDRHGAELPEVVAALNGPLAVLWAMRERRDASRACLAVVRRAAARPGPPGAAAMAALFAAWAAEGAGPAPHAPASALPRLAASAGVLGPVWARSAARLLLDANRPEQAALRLFAVKSGGGPASAAAAPALADLNGLRARIAAARGHTARAAALADRAVAAAATTDSRTVLAVALLDRADVARRCGRPAEARYSAAMAGHSFALKGHLTGAGRAAALHASVMPPECP
ncbi:hypothetical protein [Streptomyces sp. NPDC001508]|uniref:hypothetical protein n=1 Tax=Streptomyces sp. NPDC001508 TaxID=3154656 RepID=UPI003320EE22